MPLREIINKLTLPSFHQHQIFQGQLLLRSLFSLLYHLRRLVFVVDNRTDFLGMSWSTLTVVIRVICSLLINATASLRRSWWSWYKIDRARIRREMLPCISLFFVFFFYVRYRKFRSWGKPVQLAKEKALHLLTLLSHIYHTPFSPWQEGSSLYLQIE